MGESGRSEVLGRQIKIDSADEKQTLYSLLRSFIAGIYPPDGGDCSPPSSLIRRIGVSFSKNAPHLREASRNSARNLIHWTRLGSPLRALLVISVGTITLIALTGLLVFMLFFLAATLNAIIVSALMSLAAAGGFLAFFFTFLTAIYIAALSVAIFVISVTTISTIIAVAIATGWVGSIWIVLLAIKKSMDLGKKSLSITNSAISAYSTSRRAKHDEPLKSPLVDGK